MSEKINRRSAMIGGAAAIALAATGASAEAPETSLRPKPREFPVDTWESVLEERQSFSDRITERLSHYERELPHLLTFGLKVTNGDPQHRTRLDYLETAAQLDGFSAPAEHLITKMLPAKAAVESGLDASKESTAGAKGGVAVYVRHLERTRTVRSG